MEETIKTDIVKILAVDDRSQNLLVLEQYLKEPGIDVIRANSGNEALGLILEDPYALILMDVQMPDMDGFETAELIRQNSETSEIPIIFITAISKEEQHVFKGYQSGAVDYLFKPFDPVVLKSKVDVFVRLYRQKRELETLNAHLETRVEKRTQELQHEKIKAEQANLAKSRFLSNMSHELMTPLHHIINYAGFGINATKEKGDEKKNQHFDKILESGNRLQYLMQNLLDLSRLQAGTMKFFVTKNNLENIISTVLITLTPMITEKGVVVHMEESQSPPLVMGDTEKLSVLFSHILRNAIQYSDAGEKITVRFSEQTITSPGAPDLPAVQVSFIDRGIGIPEDELEMVFDRFSESSSTECNSGGKGLGLAICHEIARRHNGNIWAENAEQGTIIHIQLPAHDRELD